MSVLCKCRQDLVRGATGERSHFKEVGLLICHILIGQYGVVTLGNHRKVASYITLIATSSPPLVGGGGGGQDYDFTLPVRYSRCVSGS